MIVNQENKVNTYIRISKMNYFELRDFLLQNITFKEEVDSYRGYSFKMLNVIELMEESLNNYLRNNIINKDENSKKQIKILLDELKLEQEYITKLLCFFNM